MIAQLTGQIVEAGPNWFIIEVHGVGYRVLTTANSAARIRPGQNQLVHTTLILRQDSVTLWGFVSSDERAAFELVQAASGVGAKVAAAMLSVFSPRDLKEVILREDVRRLTTVPGVGMKSAQKIILELKDRVAALSVDGDVAHLTLTGGDWRDQVSDGLQGLGWSAKEADKACEAISDQVAENPEMSIAQLMRAALSVLAKK